MPRPLGIARCYSNHCEAHFEATQTASLRDMLHQINKPRFNCFRMSSRHLNALLRLGRVMHGGGIARVLGRQNIAKLCCQLS